jgi:hypothetical protein
VRLLADGRERTVIEGTGDPLWDDPIGAPALSGDGQWLLAVAQPQAEARYQPLFVGLLRCWNTGDGRERTLRAKPVLALGERPAWASSSREIVYAAPGPQGLASAAPLAPAMQPDPQIRRLDLATGRDELLTAGHHPVLPRVPLALVDSRYLIYTGEPSPGAPVGNTVNNSPLAGPKPMLALKVSNLASGAHETLLDGIDPRLVLAARGGAMLSRP